MRAVRLRRPPCSRFDRLENSDPCSVVGTNDVSHADLGGVGIVSGGVLARGNDS